MGLTACKAESDTSGEPLALTAFAGSVPGTVVLRWSGGPSGIVRWQYRLPQDDGDPGWRDVPLKGTYSLEHRLMGLERQSQPIVLRPRPTWRERDPLTATARGSWLEAGPDGIVLAGGWDTALEPGGTFRIESSPWVFRVPDGGAISINTGAHPHGFGPLGAAGRGLVLFTDEVSGARMVIDPRTGREPDWWPRYQIESRLREAEPEEREGYELLTVLRGSIAYAPLRRDLMVLINGSSGEIAIERPSVKRGVDWEYRIGSASSGGDTSWGPWKRIAPEEATFLLPLAWDVLAGNLLAVRSRVESGIPETVALTLPRMSPKDLVSGEGLLFEPGRSYRFGDFLLDIPDGMRLTVQTYAVAQEGLTDHWVCRTLLMDWLSGSYVLFDGGLHNEIERMVRPHPEDLNMASILVALVASIIHSPDSDYNPETDC